MDISIIIVNYNTANLVDKCIKSILLNLKGLDYNIIVVDNNSSESCTKMLKNKYSFVNFYFRDNNFGFGAGCNYGYLNSKGKYLFFLNPDTIIIDDSICKMYYYMENNKNVGVCSVIMEGENNKINYFYNNFPNLIWELYEFTGFLQNIQIKKLYKKAKENSLKTDSMEIDWAIGACLFIRRNVFELVNGFDEDFFLYYEDTDLQKRIKNEGYKIVLLNNLSIKHSGKSSIENTEKGDYIYNINMHISKLKYFKKHTGVFYVLLVRIINILAFSSRLIILPFKNQFGDNKKKRKNILLKLIKLYLGLNYAKKY